MYITSCHRTHRLRLCNLCVMLPSYSLKILPRPLIRRKINVAYIAKYHLAPAWEIIWDWIWFGQDNLKNLKFIESWLVAALIKNWPILNFFMWCTAQNVGKLNGYYKLSIRILRLIPTKLHKRIWSWKIPLKTHPAYSHALIHVRTATKSACKL